MNETCVLTTFFNPLNSKLRIDNFYLFLDNLKKSIDIKNFYVLEILNTTQESKIKGCNVINVLSNDILWQKEAGLNYLIKNIDLSTYSKVVVTDCDLFFKDYDWVNKTSELLDSYHLCQPFRSIKYLNLNRTETENIIDGVVYGYLAKNKDAQYGNGGLIVAYNKDYLDYMNGFFDKSVVGGGDTFNILPFLYNCKVDISLFENLMKDVRTEYLDYLLKARGYINSKKEKLPCIFADYTVNHLFHGSLFNRGYYTRYSILDNYSYYENFEQKNGIVGFKENSSLVNPIKEYFINRKEIIEESRPIVWCNTKNIVEKNDEHSFIWLSDENKFIFSNILKLKMEFKRTLDINRVVLYNDDFVSFLNFDSNNIAEVVIDNPKKLEIFSEYFVPQGLGKNDDTRRLSIMLKGIKVVTDDTDGNYVDYSLDMVL